MTRLEHPGIVLGLLGVIGLLAVVHVLYTPETVFLWPEGAPGALGTAPRDRPRLEVYRPFPWRRTSTAAVVAPGGGYAGLSSKTEGDHVAWWLNSLGITAFVLHYRLPTHGYEHPLPLEDARRALALVRSQAPRWGLQPDSVGMVGFSAGGHLAAMTAHTPERPDFLVLVYPVTSFCGDDIGALLYESLVGGGPQVPCASLSPALLVTADHPPTFLVHAQDDALVPASHSQRLHDALLDVDVDTELILGAYGGHAFGLDGPSPELETWPESCARWIRSLEAR